MKMTKKLMLPAFLLLCFGLASCNNPKEEKPTDGVKTIYISPTGQATNKGTEDSPYDVYTAFPLLNKGDTLKVLPGTYDVPRKLHLSKSGDAQNYITVVNESDQPAIFDFSKMIFLGTNRGIELAGSFWNFKNLEIKGAGDNGMYVGGSYNIIEDCVFYENRDTGLQLGRSSGTYTDIKDWPSYNLIKNCTSYNNYDDETFGENADGFAAKLTVGYGNVFDGCIAYRNSDDGWDLFAKEDSGNIGTVFLYNCVSFENGFLLNKVNEAGVERFVTRDGDGIGFKLGGSTMKGDVVLQNCVSFNNRLHGIGDNSNPGVISVNNCTCYNNCASIDDEGKVVISGDKMVKNESESANFDIARSEKSYNNYSNLLSYVTNSTALADRYLGSMYNSILHAGGKTYTRFEDYTDASCLETNKRGTDYKGMSDDIFKSVEAINGLNNRDVHRTLRNADGSIQLGDFLSLVDGELKNSGIGADLTKKSYSGYQHVELTPTQEGATMDEITVSAAYGMLQVNCNPKAVYQNMLVPVTMGNCEITWKSGNKDIVEVSEDVRESISSSQETYLIVHRPAETTKVTVTADILLNNTTKTKTFELNIMGDNPGIGNIYALGVTDKIIIDQYERFDEPKLIVTNSADYSGKVLSSDKYDVKKEVIYSETKTSKKYVVDSVYSSTPGVYTLKYTVKMKNSDQEKNYEYQVFVCNPTSEIDFVDEVNAFVNRDGFTIEGELSNVSGYLYVYASENEEETVDSVKENGEKLEFRDDHIKFNFEKDNSVAYYIHAVVVNRKENNDPEVHTTPVSLVEISSEQEFMDLVTGNSADKSTIYLLTKDLDFADKDWVKKGNNTFRGLINGQDHKVSNVSNLTDGYLFYKFENATLMNLNFENISLKSSANKIGIIGTMYGGYIHNVKITNINVEGTDRAGGLVGQIGRGINYFSRISIINDEEHMFTGSRTSAMIGFAQDETGAEELSIFVSDCLIRSNIGQRGNQYVGGVIGRLDNRQSFMTMTIQNVVFEGRIVAGTYAGGIVGGFNYGHSQINVSNCLSIFSGEYNSTEFTEAQKNCSPIIGRFTTNVSGGRTMVYNCYANYGEYNSDFDSTFEDFAENIVSFDFYQTMLRFDMKNTWSFDEDTKVLSLR